MSRSCRWSSRTSNASPESWRPSTRGPDGTRPKKPQSHGPFVHAWELAPREIASEPPPAPVGLPAPYRPFLIRAREEHDLGFPPEDSGFAVARRAGPSQAGRSTSTGRPPRPFFARSPGRAPPLPHHAGYGRLWRANSRGRSSIRARLSRLFLSIPRVPRGSPQSPRTAVTPSSALRESRRGARPPRSRSRGDVARPRHRHRRRGRRTASRSFRALL